MPDSVTVTGPSITSEPSIPEVGRACLVNNAASGANLKHGLERVERVAAGAGLRCETVGDVDELSRVLRECARRGDRLIIVNAGDGTVSRVIEHLRNDRWFDVEPVLALLRGGTTNMIHNDTGIAGRPDAALRRLLNGLERGRCAHRARHVLRVATASRPAPRYGFFFATHGAVKAILRTRERLHRHVSTGRLSELLSIVAMIWRLLRRRVAHDPVLAPVPLALSRDGEPWCRRGHILLLAITVRTAVLGIRPLRRGQHAGLAELSWPGYRLGPWVRRFLAGSLESFETLALRGTFAWVLDGEVYELRDADGALTVEVDAPVRFLVPGNR